MDRSSPTSLHLIAVCAYFIIDSSSPHSRRAHTHTYVSLLLFLLIVAFIAGTCAIIHSYAEALTARIRIGHNNPTLEVDLRGLIKACDILTEEAGHF